MPGGRPSTYSKEIADRICNELSEGASLVAICGAADMPHPSTVYDWLKSNPEFADNYTHARETQAERYAAEIIEIADSTQEGEKRVVKGDGTVEIHRGDMTEHRKMRIDARKWTAAKLKPKVYGDRQQIDLTGTLVVTDMSDDDLMAELSQLVATGVIKAPTPPAEEPDPNEDLL